MEGDIRNEKKYWYNRCIRASFDFTLSLMRKLIKVAE